MASLLCSVAQSPGQLIAARVLQGLLGAMVLPQGLAMIKEMFPPKEMAAAFGAFGPIMGLSAVGGPILAGYLLDADLFGTGWRAIFGINLPIGILTVLAAIKYLPNVRPERRVSLDWVGVLLGGAGAALIVYPLVQGRELGWPLWTFALMAGSVATFALFAWHERRVSAAGGDPLVEPSLFRKRAFAGGMVVGLAFFSAMIGFSLVFTLYVQVGLGWAPLRAALAGTPMAVGMVLGFIAAGAGLANRFGRRLIHGGTLLMIVGLAVLVLGVRSAAAGVAPWHFAPAMALTGTGMGLAMAPFFDIILAGVEPKETGSAGGTLTAIQQLGSALGVAVLGTVFFAAVGGALSARADDAAPALHARLASLGVAAPAQDAIVTGLRDCVHDRAVAEDPLEVPPSCLAPQAAIAGLSGGAVSDAAADHGIGFQVAAAVAASGQDSARQGFGDVMQLVLWVEGGMMAASFGLTFLLPKRARPEDVPEDEPAPEGVPVAV
jgi:predicted MFS family arabinose efflux permease